MKGVNKMLSNERNKMLKGFLDYLKGKGLSHHTIRGYKTDLEGYMAKFKKFDKSSIEKWLSSLRCSNKTKERKLTALKTFLKWKGLILELPKVRPEKKIPYVLSEMEAMKLLKACETSRNPLRDKTFISLLLYTGLRISEALELTTESIEERDDTFFLRVQQGKGKKDRLIPLVSDSLLDLLAGYMTTLPNGSRLFPFSSREANYLIKRLAKKAGITKPVSPHTLRHTSATLYLKKGVNLEVLRKLLGHSSLSTTQKYLSLTNEDMAMELRKVKLI